MLRLTNLAKVALVAVRAAAGIGSDASSKVLARSCADG
jgi:hypothetical protein